MNFIILGKSLRKGTIGSDSSDLSVYFELGWEVVGSRIDIINLINQNLLSESDTVLVTSEDRKFMYTKFYKNTITYEEFQRVKKDDDIVHDWTQERNFRFLNAYNNFVDLDTKKYKYYDRDHELIFNGYDLDGSKFKNYSEKFIVLSLRFREHNSHKNALTNVFDFLVDNLKKTVTKNIFVVGYGSDDFCKRNDCVYIENLQDYVSLIKNKNCISLISQSTGTLCLALTSSETHIQLIDHTMCSDIEGDNAVLGGKCMHFFSNGMTTYYSLDIPTTNKILEKTNQLCIKN
jgi:hypothetical protein